MPAPERTSLDAIVRAGRELLESGGVAGLTMQAIAERVGVRAPSLYKRVRNRDELVRLVAAATVADLSRRIDDAVGATRDVEGNVRLPEGSRDPAGDVARLARAVRAFALQQPAAFTLVFTSGDESGLDVESLRAASATVLAVAAELAGPEHALEAARLLTAWVTGFVSMELSGAFRLGGDVEAAFEFGIVRIGAALARE